jgi:serine phosphatase RsbU (regulator of sigma subunit)
MLKRITRPLLLLFGAFFLPFQNHSQIKNLIDSANYYRKHDVHKGTKFADSALKLSHKTGNTGQLCEAYLLSGQLLHDQSRYKQALDRYAEAEKYANQNGNKLLVASVYNNMALSFERLGNFDKALALHSKALNLRSEMQSRPEIGASYQNIGSLYFYAGDFNKALQNTQKALEIFESLHDLKLTGEVSLNVGAIYFNMFKDSLALQYMKKALSIALRIHNANGIENAYNNLSNYYAELNHPVLARFYLNKIISLAANNPEKKISIYINLAKIFEKSKVKDSAEYYYKMAAAVAGEIGFRNKLMLAYDELSNFYKAQGDYQRALDYAIRAYQLRDSLSGIQHSKDLAEIEAVYKTERQSKEIDLLSKQYALEKESANKSRLLFLVSLAVLLLAILSGVALYRNYAIKKRDNLLLSEKNEEIRVKSDLIAQKQHEILDSLNYARRIQFALLANESLLDANIGSGNYFILFKPKDIVSGDFYWAAKKDDRFYVAVCDCTGHGVPGAFMSLLNISFLNEAINEKGLRQPNDILEHVRNKLVENISRDGARDGMDAILMCFETLQGERQSITYAAANITPVLVQNNSLNLLPCDKMPVGKGEREALFTHHTIHANKGDVLYLFSDGYADQFGGARGKKFKYKNLHELLLNGSAAAMLRQRGDLEAAFESWKGSIEQVDDICVIGIKITSGE